MIYLLLQEACDLAARTLADSDVYYEECLNTFKFNDTARTQIINTMLSLNEIYSFKNAANSTNMYNLPKVDLKTSLKNYLKETFESDFAFHSTLTNLYEKLKDAHTKYRAPNGYELLEQFLPVYPRYDYATDAFYLTQIESEPYLTMSEQYFESHEEQREFLGKKIMKMNGQEIVAALTDYADYLVGKSKEQNARFNEMLRQAFFYRKIGRYPFSYKEEFVFTFEDQSNTSFKMQIYADEPVSRDKIERLNKPSTQSFAQSENEKFDTVDRSSHTPRKAGTARVLSSDIRLIEYLDLNGKPKGFLLEILTFSPNNVTEFVDAFQAACQVMDAAQGDNLKLVISLIQNGGGYITLGFRSLAVLAPYIQPRYGQYSIQKEPLNDFFTTSHAKGNTFSTQKRYNYSTYELFTKNQWFNKTTVAEFDKETGDYSFDLAYDELPEKEYQRLVNTKTPWWLDTPENTNIAIVSDGLCGSTCACFALRAKSGNNGLQAALFLSIGGIPNEKSATTAIASFPGGSVMRVSYTDLFNLSKYGVEKFPMSVYFGWTHEQIYVWEFDNYTTAEYYPQHVDDNLKIWPLPDQRWMTDEVMDEVYNQAYKKLTEKTYGFEVKIGDCKSEDHGFYGKNSSSKECFLFSCEKNYMLQGGKCVKVPAVFTPAEGGMGVGFQIAICVLVVIVGIAMCGVVVYYTHQSKKEYKKIATA